jgi:hypothetical protein
MSYARIITIMLHGTRGTIALKEIVCIVIKTRMHVHQGLLFIHIAAFVGSRTAALTCYIILFLVIRLCSVESP